jgi:hypothetical protein
MTEMVASGLPAPTCTALPPGRSAAIAARVVFMPAKSTTTSRPKAVNSPGSA